MLSLFRKRALLQKKMQCCHDEVKSGFPEALETMENLENQEKKFNAWNNHGNIMEFSEII